MDIPIVNIGALLSETEDHHGVAARIGQACRDCGFFYIINHGVDEHLERRLEEVSQQFFAQALETKLEIDMSRGGRAWRGYFPVGGELTSGKPDLKEGIYFGAELNDDHPLVKAGTPLHGPNLFPTNMPQLRQLVLDYMAAMTQLGHRLMAGISLSLGLEESYFAEHYTDHGLLTILRQDMSGGLQVKIKSHWVEAPPIARAFVCNVGDMLDRLTGGLYLSAPHRARNLAGHNRLSFAFFF